jgi:hypothetical protein
MNAAEVLRRHGVQTDLIYFARVPRPKDPAIHPAWRYLGLSEAKVLNEYDAVVFNSAGSWDDRKAGSWWTPVLAALKVPFAVWTCNEVETEVCPYRSKFVAHEMYALAIEVSEGLAGANGLWKGGVNVLRHSGLPSPQAPGRGVWSWRPGAADAVVAGPKEPKIVTTCRLTSRKRVLELASLGPKLRARGIGLDVWGAESTFFYKRGLLELRERQMREGIHAGGDRLSDPGWEWKGGFTHNELSEILAPAMFHWGGAWLVRGVMRRRLELATVEAVAHGCIPILERSTAPEWVDGTIAVLFHRGGVRALPDALANVAEGSAAYRDAMVEGFVEGLNEHEDPEGKSLEIARQLGVL